MPLCRLISQIERPKNQAIIDYRLSRVEAGVLGDYKSLGDGVYEFRIHHGPGWRIYFAKAGKQIILLLCDSDKSSQKTQIIKAKTFWKDYQQQREVSSP